MNKAELKELVRVVLAEDSEEPEIIQIARRIVKNQQFEKVNQFLNQSFQKILQY